MTARPTAELQTDLAAMRRGACPTLGRPMPTGDGLLARLRPEDCRLTMAQLRAVARAAAGEVQFITDEPWFTDEMFSAV